MIKYLFKIIIIFLIWYLWKFIAFAVFLNTLSLLFISYKVYKSENITSLHPIISTNLIEDNYLFMFNTILNNLVFDIIYKYVNKDLNIGIKWRDIALRIVLWWLGLPKLMLKIFYLILTINNITNLLAMLAYKERDSRTLIRTDGRWESNSEWSLFSKSFRNAKPFRDISDYDYSNIIKLLKPSFDKLKKFASKPSIINEQYLAKTQENKMEHWYTTSMAMNEYVYMTDAFKAIKKNNYNKEVMINKFYGDKKMTTALIEEKDIIISKKRLVSEQNLYTGALSYGYNEKKITKASAENLKELELIIEEMKDVIQKDPTLSHFYDKPMLIINMMQANIDNALPYAIEESQKEIEDFFKNM